MGNNQLTLLPMALIATLLGVVSCGPASAPNSVQETKPHGEELGKWVASCTDSDIDAQRLFDDVDTYEKSLLHATGTLDSHQFAAMDNALKPLANCDPRYLIGLADTLPKAWETSGAERFSDRIIPEDHQATPPGIPPTCTTCVITGSIEFEHPRWGKSTLTTYISAHEEGSPAGLWGYKATDQSGKTVFDKRVDNDNMYSVQIVGQDSNHNIFISYNPGRYDGLIVLRPSEDGLFDFGTDSFPRTYNGRFYYAEAQTQADGSYNILLSMNDCHPSCAGGTTTSTNWIYDAELNDFVKK